MIVFFDRRRYTILMNKKGVFVILMVCVLVLNACFSPWKGDEGTFNIVIGKTNGKAAGREAAENSGSANNSNSAQIPDGLLHTIILSGGPGPKQERKDVAYDTTVNFSVTPGRWNISVTAFLGEKIYATGSAHNVNIKPGPNGSIHIPMNLNIESETITLSGTIDTGGIKLNDETSISTFINDQNQFANITDYTWSLTIPYEEEMDPVVITGEFWWNTTSHKTISYDIPIDGKENDAYSNIILPLSIKVTKSADSAADTNDSETLRGAIAKANTAEGSDIIVIDIAGTSPTIVLTSPLPEITSDITIIAKNQAVTITRNDSFTKSLFTIETTSASSGKLTLGGEGSSPITLDGGNKAVSPAIAIIADAPLIIINNSELVMNEGITLRNNSDEGSYGGGVRVENSGKFTMNGGTISGNTILGSGGGVYVNGGTFHMNGGIISGNTATAYGGGVYVTGGTFQIAGGTVYGSNADDSYKNTADDDGAALFVETSSTPPGTAQYGTFTGIAFQATDPQAPLLETRNKTFWVDEGKLKE